MRIWDINPGYLNRQSLLGEHRELHGIVSIIVNGKKGYSKHPETLRWVGYEWALKMRHELLVAEMSLRGFNEKTPVLITSNEGIFNEGVWPEKYIDAPWEQLALLAEKYKQKEQGRILLPKNGQQLWSQHKYSVMARNVPLYKKIGREVANTSSPDSAADFSALAALLTETLRTAPSPGGIRNALQHMWGYVSDHVPGSERNTEDWSLSKLLQSVQQGALESQEPYLLASTALSELKIWIPKT
ncbi:DUF1722 domain-containing protein [Desulfobulbus sp. US1]|nr:DUF1722 domain-containing protein [Desulfobulbus sp. US4]MCW5208515.1 DUF1722 domain-containing protein [Desulfobulbus sp. US2]MCW5209776.1 DUF1722 domain-containing protein [Desulfobulbus sp. US1]